MKFSFGLNYTMAGSVTGTPQDAGCGTREGRPHQPCGDLGQNGQTVGDLGKGRPRVFSCCAHHIGQLNPQKYMALDACNFSSPGRWRRSPRAVAFHGCAPRHGKHCRRDVGLAKLFGLGPTKKQHSNATFPKKGMLVCQRRDAGPLAEPTKPRTVSRPSVKQR